MPTETVQPIVLYYDKRSFDKVGAEPPKSWDDMMSLVDKFNGPGIAPFSLGGQSSWTNMMWLEYLLDRSAARRCSRTSSTTSRTRGPTRRSSSADQDPGPGEGERLH